MTRRKRPRPVASALAGLSLVAAAAAAACGVGPTGPDDDSGSSARVLFSRTFPAGSATADSGAPLPLRPLAREGLVVFGGPGGRVLAFRPGDGELLWRTDPLLPEALLGTELRELAGPWAQPVVAGGAVVVPAPAPGGGLVALDRDAGEVLWRWEPADDVLQPGALAAAGGRVVAGTAGGRLLALDAGTGEAVWSKDLDARPFGLATSGDTLFLGMHGLQSFGGTVETPSGPLRGLALSAADGGELWRFEPDGAPGAASVPRAGASVADGTLLLPGGTGAIFGLDPFDGTPRWEALPRGGPARGVVALGRRALVQPEGGPLALVDAASGEVVQPALDGGTASLYPPAGAAGLAVVNLRSEVVAVRPDGSVAWRHSDGGGFTTAPAVHDGVVYVGAAHGFVALAARP